MRYSVGIALITLILSLFGGVQFYYQPFVIEIFLPLAAIVWSMLKLNMEKPPPLLWPVIVMIACMFISTLFNMNVLPAAMSRIFLAAVALAAMILAAAIPTRDIRDGLFLAGTIWPLLLYLAGQYGNVNILAVFPVIFVAVSLDKFGNTGGGDRQTGYYQKLFYLMVAGVNVTALVYLGSRGALIGLAAVLVVSLKDRVKSSYIVAALPLAVLLAVLLIAWRPQTDSYRLYYWQQALMAWQKSPWLGVAPGGIKYLELIREPGYEETQVHAHNVIISTLTELGLVGLAGLIGSTIYASRITHYERWQWAIIAGLVAHSMVDQPLWWPGPLLLAAIITSSDKEKSNV